MSPKLGIFTFQHLLQVLHLQHNQARSQKFAVGGCFGGLVAEPSAAEGQWAGGQWGSGGKDPNARKFCILCKNNLILGLLTKNIAFKTWYRNWQRNMIQLVALMGYVGDG